MEKTTVQKKFIEILDEYQHIQDFQYQDLNNVLQISNLYYKNRFIPYLSNVTDTTKPLITRNFVAPPQNNKTGFEPIKQSRRLTIDTNFYNLYTQSNWNTSFAGSPVPSLGETMTRSFLKDVSHSNPFQANENVKAKPVIKHHKTIDVKITEFSDLLSILKDNEYKEDIEYNIDLKALHQVKTELEELDAMIGMTSFKNSVLDQILYFVQNLHHGKDPDFMHTVLAGPPGTGKTEIAKILGKMYSKIGILKQGVFKKVTRSDLVAGYLGQTAIKTKKMITECLGGCLFIDEAYSLANDYEGDSYSRECLDTLCEALSDHKGELMVIIAGYEDELNSTFFKANKGLNSRFLWRFNIEDYSAKELMDIFIKKVDDNEWKIDFNTNLLLKWFEKQLPEFKHFGRDMELLFSCSKIAHGRRIYGKPAELRKRLSLDDIQEGFVCFQANLNKKKQNKQYLYGLYT
jgi:SpoVK/Ycf46/Vps4 family AAA+-type ATPase